jgi:hypothetical protein
MLLTKLTTVFELFENERDAVDSFFPERASKERDVAECRREPVTR